MGQGTGRAGISTGDDVAQIQVLEAVLIAVIMLGAVGFVLTFTLPTSETEPTRQGLDARASEALAVLNDLPVDDTRYGGNMLAYAVARALEGDASVLEARLRTLLPPATKFNVYLANGQESYPVYESGTPRGETVTATHVLEPKWQYTFVDRDAGVLAAPNTLGVYALPVFNSNLIDDGGVLVEVSVDFEQSGHRWTKQAYYSTVQGGRDRDGHVFSSTIFGSDAGGAPLAYQDRTDPAGQYDGSEVVYATVVQDEPGGTIPAGTRIVFRLPQGLQGAVETLAGEYEADADADEVDPSRGGTLEVLTLRDITAGTPMTIAFKAYDTGDRPYQYFVVDATVAGTAHGKAEIVLQDRVSTTFTGGDYIDVFASVPKPMGFTEPNTWAVVVADAPTQPDAFAPVRVERVVVRQPDGIGLFADAPVDVLKGPPGDFEVVDSGSALVWTPTVAYAFEGTESNKAFELAFRPQPAGVTTRDESTDYLTVPVTVNDGADAYTTHLTRRVEPALFYGQIPPKVGMNAGYEDDAGTGHEVRAAPVHRGQELPGAWTYDTGVVTLKDFISTATIDVEPREAPVGGRATIHINVENLITNLMLRGFSVKTYTSVFPPWSITEHEPLIRELSEETTADNKDVTQVVLRDITGDAVLDIIVGTNEGKLVAFDLGNGGAVISGHTRTWGGQAVTGLAALDVDGETYFVVGLAKDVSTGAVSLNTLRVLDEDFFDRPLPYAFDLGVHDVTSVSAGLDLDRDGAEDYVVGDARGTTAAFDGSVLEDANDPQRPISAGWPHEANARSALTAMGLSGPVPTRTAIVTDGLEASVGIWRAAEYPTSTNANDPLAAALDLVKRFSIATNSDGLLGFDAGGKKVWGFPAGGFTKIDATDVDDDGTTDVVAGTWDGYVYAVNGRQAAMPWLGLSIASGDQISDADFVDANVGWTVDPQGFAMRTRDGWTTRDYANGLPVSTPGAYGLDLVTRDVGFIVGAGSVMWKTLDGGLTVDPHSYVIKDPASTPLVPLPNLYPGGTWGTSNYLDVEFYDADNGIVVGGPCGAYCAGHARPLYTNDGGATWYPGTIEAVNGPLSLERVKWAAAGTAYAVGTPGKVYKTTDGGKNWVPVPPTANPLDAWHGLDCLDALTCWVVGDGGKMYKTTNGGTSWTLVATGVTADLHDVDFLDAQYGIAVGEQTVVLTTKDGGANWMLAPGGGPLVADWTTVNYVAPDIAYFFGGNSTTRAYGITASYESSAYATTKTFFTSDTDAYHSNTVISTARIRPMAYNNEYTSIIYEISTDGGDSWKALQPKDPNTLDLLGRRAYPWQAVPGGGSSLTMRYTLGVNLDYVFNTPILREIQVDFNATFTCKRAILAECEALAYVHGCDATTRVCKETRTISVPIAGGAVMDLSKTTAEYVEIGGAYEVRLPRVEKFWTAYVKGAVNDLDASRDVDGDGYNDVVVAVGPHQPAKGVGGARVNKVMLLDGFTGRTLATYTPDPFGSTAEPWRVRYADVGMTGAAGTRATGGPPEIVLTAADTAVGGAVDGQVVVLDTSMAVLDRWQVLGRPDVLVVADTDQTDAAVSDDFVVGTTENAVGTPGAVYVYSATDARGAAAWTMKARVSPEIGGRYVVNWDVARDAAYGPYIVETEVTWTDPGTGEVQSLFLNNYFTVTPPNARLPVSPVYTVHLVTWFEDWDVARS